VRRGVAGALAICLALAGCASPKALQPSMAEQLPRLLDGQALALRIEPGERRLLRAESSNDGAAIIAHGEQSARNFQGSVSGAGNGGAGAGVALGVAIGTALAAGMGQSSVQDAQQVEADKQVAPLQQALDGQPLTGWFDERFAAALREAGRPLSDAAVLELVVAPQGVLSHDGHSARLVSEVRLMQGREALYRGRIEVQGQPVACSACLDDWAANGGRSYLQALDLGVRETVRVLLLDWRTGHFAGQLGEERTLRYQVGESRYVERGRLWRDNSGKGALFLTLRGWIKSVPVGVEP